MITLYHPCTLARQLVIFKSHPHLHRSELVTSSVQPRLGCQMSSTGSCRPTGAIPLAQIKLPDFLLNTNRCNLSILMRSSWTMCNRSCCETGSHPSIGRSHKLAAWSLVIGHPLQCRPCMVWKMTRKYCLDLWRQGFQLKWIHSMVFKESAKHLNGLSVLCRLRYNLFNHCWSQDCWSQKTLFWPVTHKVRRGRRLRIS